MSTNKLANLASFNLANQSWVTTDEELRTVLKRCRYCSNCTNKGENIVSYEKLNTVKINKKTNNCIVINTAKSGSQSRLGHWICLFIGKTGQALLFDSLNTIYKSNPLVCSKIKSFCNKILREKPHFYPIAF